jgi:hypothetical protein
MLGRPAKREKMGITTRARTRDRRLPTGGNLAKITGRETGTWSAPFARSARSTPVAERSKYQDKIIKNYYQNRDAIALQRLGELVSELYLAEGKARARKWKNVEAALEKLKIPPARIAHLVKQDNPALVAKLVEELMAK